MDVWPKFTLSKVTKFIKLIQIHIYYNFFVICLSLPFFHIVKQLGLKKKKLEKIWKKN